MRDMTGFSLLQSILASASFPSSRLGVPESLRPASEPDMAQTQSEAQPYASSDRSQPASPSRNLLSRLRAPFLSRNRVLSEYFVRLDEPYRHYAPGDTIAGAVVLSALKPVRLTHLVVCFHGFVQIFKGAGAGARKLRKPVCGGEQIEERDGERYLSVCHDKVVLCAQGRLEAGVYEFRFELEVTGDPLPASIDFERGTISYNVISTMTRPNNATASCERRLRLIENIDVGHVDPPKRQHISLAPSSRRSKGKAALKPDTSSTTKIDAGSVEAARLADASPSPPLGSPAEAAPRGSLALSHQPPPSEFSADSSLSETSGALGSSRQDARPRAPSQQRSESPIAKFSLCGRSVTATAELSRGGCLPGDVMSVRITVNHLKAIKSFHGIIVTFYRQSRIDVSPLIAKDGASSQTNGSVPKAKSGLGGLSFSSSAVRRYRMDLSQTLLPLIVDPRTLQTSVRASVKIPDDVFPTIRSVPWDIIDFRYYIEVALDLKGRLASQDSFLSQIGITTSTANYSSLSTSAVDVNSNHGEVPSTWKGSVIDTERLRRENRVVSRTFEVTVGTKDSSRGAPRPRSERISDCYPATENDVVDVHRNESMDPLLGAEDDVIEHRRPHTQDRSPVLEYDTTLASSSSARRPSPARVAPPEIDVPVDEKTRLRQAEARLLPSRPPGIDDETPPYPSSIVGPSAPVLPANGEAVDDTGWTAAGDWLLPPPSAPRMEALPPPATTGPFESLHSYSHSHFPLTETSGASSSEDKQELERRRLQAEASAPDDRICDDLYTEEEGGRGREGRAALGLEQPTPAPSAPMLTEDDLAMPVHAIGPSSSPSFFSISASIHNATGSRQGVATAPSAPSAPSASSAFTAPTAPTTRYEVNDHQNHQLNGTQDDLLPPYER